MDKYEERFFKCFGIERCCINILPDGQYCKGRSLNCEQCGFYAYPEITDSILLDLICILNSKANIYDREYYKVKDRNKLKFVILKDCVYNKELIQKEVVKLFKEN